MINILQFSGRFGIPEPKDQTINLLLQHGRKIYQNLEYYGEVHTGNHLANNGRGLYLGGLMLGITSWVDIGGKINQVRYYTLKKREQHSAMHSMDK